MNEQKGWKYNKTTKEPLKSKNARLYFLRARIDDPDWISKREKMVAHFFNIQYDMVQSRN